MMTSNRSVRWLASSIQAAEQHAGHVLKCGAKRQSGPDRRFGSEHEPILRFILIVDE